MEIFKDLLFGISGLSLIFWVSVIGIWHVDMFPRMFQEDCKAKTSPALSESQTGKKSQWSNSLLDRNMYSRKSLVIANFNNVNPNYSNNRLYTLFILNLFIMSFILITYGLRSGFYFIN